MAPRNKVAMKGRLYTYGLGQKHKLQKKQVIEKNVRKYVAAVTAKLQYCIQDFHGEEVRTLRGLGQYRLAPGYESFYVDIYKLNISAEQQDFHVKKYLWQLNPRSFDA